MNSNATVLTPRQQEIWSQAASQIEDVRSGERAFASQVKQYLLDHPGYLVAARERTAELLSQHSDRPHWHWAWKRWQALIAEDGLQGVLSLLDDPDLNQELISASPFTVMRPPLPENGFYQSHDPSRAQFF